MFLECRNFLILHRKALIITILGAIVALPLTAAAQPDISGGITSATASFTSIIKTIFTVAAVVIVVGGLALAAFKFSQRDPHALHHLVGAIAAALICGIIAGIL